MAQMWLATVVVVAVMVGAVSVVHATTVDDVELPQGPEGKRQVIRQVTSADDSVSRHYNPSWAFVIRTDGAQSSRQKKIKNPSNSYIVRNVRILYSLCHKEGVYSMFHDCHYFYYCLPNVIGSKSKFHQILGVCEEGYSFDEMITDCVPKSCYPSAQNNPIYSPPGTPQDSIRPPSPAAQKVPNWLNEEPVWYSKKPALFKTPPDWYYTPPAWYNTPPTPRDTGNHKTQTSQGEPRSEVEIMQED